MGTFRALRWGNDSLSSEKILFSIWENVGIENSPCLKFWTYLDQISSVPNNSWFQGCYFHLRCHHHRHCRQGCLSWVWQRCAIAWSEISSAAKIWDELATTEHIWHLSGGDQVILYTTHQNWTHLTQSLEWCWLSWSCLVHRVREVTGAMEINAI